MSAVDQLDLKNIVRLLSKSKFVSETSYPANEPLLVDVKSRLDNIIFTLTYGTYTGFTSLDLKIHGVFGITVTNKSKWPKWSRDEKASYHHLVCGKNKERTFLIDEVTSNIIVKKYKKYDDDLVSEILVRNLL